MILAHLTKANGIRKEQSLKEHCINTARYASESLRLPGFYHTAYLAGLLHDMGKATEKFHVYLEKAYHGEEVLRGSVNHTFAGVVYLLENYHMDIKEKIPVGYQYRAGEMEFRRNDNHSKGRWNIEISVLDGRD